MAKVEKQVLTEVSDADFSEGGRFIWPSYFFGLFPRKIIAIGLEAFKGRAKLRSIAIPDSVTDVGSDAFSHCTNLSNIIIPESVGRIGPGAFLGCGSLRSIVIPVGVTRIGMHAFAYCASLSSIVIPVGVTRINPYAFWYCTSLRSIVIPNDVTEIGWNAFYNCRNIKSIIIPNAGDIEVARIRNLFPYELQSKVISERLYKRTISVQKELSSWFGENAPLAQVIKNLPKELLELVSLQEGNDSLAYQSLKPTMEEVAYPRTEAELADYKRRLKLHLGIIKPESDESVVVDEVSAQIKVAEGPKDTRISIFVGGNERCCHRLVQFIRALDENSAIAKTGRYTRNNGVVVQLSEREQDRFLGRFDALKALSHKLIDYLSVRGAQLSLSSEERGLIEYCKSLKQAVNLSTDLVKAISGQDEKGFLRELSFRMCSNG